MVKTHGVWFKIHGLTGLALASSEVPGQRFEGQGLAQEGRKVHRFGLGDRLFEPGKLDPLSLGHSMSPIFSHHPTIRYIYIYISIFIWSVFLVYNRWLLFWVMSNIVQYIQNGTVTNPCLLIAYDLSFPTTYLFLKGGSVKHIPSDLTYSYLVGGIPKPLKNMKVSWEYYSQFVENNSFFPNHQPNTLVDCLLPGFNWEYNYLVEVGIVITIWFSGN